MYKGKARLLTLSPICDNLGYPHVGGYLLIGHSLDGIFGSAAKIIPINVSLIGKPSVQAGVIEKKGFWPGERLYISIRPKILIHDYARKAFIFFILFQVALGFVAFWLITPYSTRKYTAHLRDVIRSRTGALKKANAELEHKGHQLNRELQMARVLQERTIGVLPETPLLDIRTSYVSMDAVGGDVIDIRKAGDGVFSCMIADVTGHGVPAALIASMAKISLLNHIDSGRRPDEICRRVNDDLFSLIGDTGYFLTAFFCMLDTSEMRLLFCNCGHVNPVILRSDSGEIIVINTARCKPLGLMGNLDIMNDSVGIVPGDKIVLYTDGIIEARDASGAFYGMERLYDFLDMNRNLPPGELIEAFNRDLEAFCRGKDPDDDRAMIIIEVLKRNGSVSG